MNSLNQRSGIYQIINLQTGKCYIGQAKNITNRCARHRYLLKHNKHPNKHLQNAWNKDGSQSFEFRRIVNLPLDKNLLLAAEQYWYNYFKESGVYNLRIITESNLGIKRKGGMLGKKHTSETRAKMSAWQVGRKMSDEAKKKMSLAKVGKVYWAKGRKLSEETRRKISEVQLRPVESICPKTGLVIEYKSLTHAVQSLNSSIGALSCCLTGRSKTHRKLYWNYLSEVY